MHRGCSVLFLSFAFATLVPAAPPAGNEWMVLLADPPVVARFPGRIEQTRAASDSYRNHLRGVQQDLRTQIEAMSVSVTGAVQHVLNGIFVRATPEQAAALGNLPGVEGVLPMRIFHLNDQLSMSDVQQAWSSAKIGGLASAGAGLKIGIIDTGIDQTHPSFQDSSLTPPAGFPKCDQYALGNTIQSDCAFTNNKVIVARSYVSMANTGTTAANSRPDDLSARDYVGHGTAVASVVAGVVGSLNSATISGVAPKAFLGSYKIYGSPELGEGASESGIIQAFDDAVADGMDVVNFSSGSTPIFGPTDTGATCGLGTGQPCDALAAAFENAMKNGQVIVVVSAGNDGATGYRAGSGVATYGSIESPADAPSVIAAGGVQNDIAYAASMTVNGGGVPSSLARLTDFPAVGNPLVLAPITAPLTDVVQIGADPLLCTAPAAGSLSGAVALISRGTCNFSVKVQNAQTAGAVAVVLINSSSNPTTLTGWGGLGSATIPAYMLSQSDGQSLQTYVDAHSGTTVTLNPALQQISDSTVGLVADTVATFASRGPALGTNGLKPDVSAVATNFLMAAQDIDPFGALFSATQYGVANGTSFSAPMLAGAAALVKQAQPGLTPLQVKSALVNTATLSGVLNQSGTGSAALADAGSGLLQAQNAVLAPVLFVPSTVSFGSVTGALPGAQTVTVTNNSGAALSLNFSVAATVAAAATTVQVNGAGSATLSLSAGQSSTISVRLSGSVPTAGRYEGLINVTGASVPLHIPYLFVAPANSVYDVIPLFPGFFDGPASQELPAQEGGFLGIRVVDRFGMSVGGAPVQWATVQGGGQVLSGVQYTDTQTDAYGHAFATIVLGPTAGAQSFSATVSGLTVTFSGTARNVPAISAGGIVDGASFTANRAVAPGSIVSVFGTNLADSSGGATQFPLPMGIAGAAFSFDADGVSLPAHFHYVSPTQINLQVPWELANYTSATVKVLTGSALSAFLNYTYSATYTLKLATYSPGFFNAPLGSSNVAALDLAYNVISSSHPAVRGNIVALYLNGLGPVHNQPADGWPATDATSTTIATPTITIGGQPATVGFSGLAPGFADLYQVNVTVPTGIAAGAQTVTCSIGGVSCQDAVLWVN